MDGLGFGNSGSVILLEHVSGLGVGVFLRLVFGVLGLLFKV